MVSAGVMVFVEVKSSVVVGTGGVCVDVGVEEVGAGVGDAVAGGVTRRSRFCPGWMIADEVSPPAINCKGFARAWMIHPIGQKKSVAGGATLKITTKGGWRSH